MNSDNVNNFWDFVNKHKYQKGHVNKLTHTTLGAPKGSFSFEGADHEEFMRLYVDVLKTSEISLYFVERPTDTTYLYFDIDFNHRQKNRQYNLDHIRSLLGVINSCIKDNFDVTDNQLYAYITEKPEPTYKPKEELYKDGPHIYYPYLPMTTRQRYYIMNEVSEKCKNEDIFETIPFTNKMSDIFDTSIIESNGILMYGSKKEGGYPYVLTHVFDSRLNELDIDEYDVEDLVYDLSNRRHGVGTEIASLNINIDNEISKLYENHSKKNTEKISNILVDKKEAAEKIKPEIVFHEPDAGVPAAKRKEIELATKLIHIMSIERATNYKDWMTVGFALKGISESLFDTFVEFSKRCMPKYLANRVPCEKIWERELPPNATGYSIATLRYLARMDNPHEYVKAVKLVNNKLFGKMISGKHADMAAVIHELYKDRFVCVDIEKKRWYEFKNHRWTSIQSGYSFGELISGEIRELFKVYAAEQQYEVINCEEDRDMRMKNAQKLLMTVEKLADVPFKENILRACASKFYDPEFQKNLDGNILLIGFDNGIYDLGNKCFRNGLPSDLVSKSVRYDYKEYSETHPIIARVIRFFRQVQTEPDMMDYLLTFFASTLRGKSDAKLHVWTGGGGNAKSATIDLTKNMWGDYFGVLPVTYLTTKKKSSSNATPELADKYGKRFLVIQEPEHNDVIYVGQMKEITGGDTVQARPLYGDPFEYKPQFKLVLTCNVLPQIPSDDGGTWRRLKVVPFESEFVAKNPKGPRQFLIDDELSEEFKKWAQPLMWLVINKYYPIYERGNGNKPFDIVEPAKVTAHTEKYKADSCVYVEFIKNVMKITNDETDKEHIETIYEAFKKWHISAYSEKPKPKKDMVDYLEKNKYVFEDQFVVGIKFLYLK